ncbi:MAG: hypothetical protein Ct9H90mP5_04460 [Acidimicrobiaceae bacterium]|nr:MAG: hypothetical protein Ct9H90mP5_04460 [Acidimicrobiaceae bacterium]
MNMKTPNILLIVSDQERQRDWLPAGLDLPARQRLLDEGFGKFTNYYTTPLPAAHRAQPIHRTIHASTWSLRKLNRPENTKPFPKPPPQL